MGFAVVSLRDKTEVRMPWKNWHKHKETVIFC